MIAVEPRTALANLIRGIVAEVKDRSFGGTREGTRLRGELNLSLDDEMEISWRIRNATGVSIHVAEWRHFTTVGSLVEFVVARIPEEQQA